MLIAVLCTVAIGVASQGPGEFSLIYGTTWSPAYLHYNANGNGWNGIPGEKMWCPSNTSFSCDGFKQVTVAANSVVWVTTDGHGQWDNNGGQNYRVGSPGLYLLQDGKVATLKTYPRQACPGTPTLCSGHGTCNQTTGVCTCASGYFGIDCATMCKCHGDHERCTDRGTCQCVVGFANCTGSCDTDLMTNVSNCGACGHNCQGRHVLSATCSNGHCDVVCAQGYTRCPDGTCALSCALPGCSIFQGNKCSGDAINTSDRFASHTWQTPSHGSDGYRPSYQSYDRLVAHGRLVYSSQRTSVDVTVVWKARDSIKVVCSFDGGAHFSTPCTSSFSAPRKGPIHIVVRGSDGSEIALDAIDFWWDHPTVRHSGGDYRDGQKGALVELFGWRHVDIRKECAFLAKAGYLGARLYPAQEQIMSTQPFNNAMNPWYFAYQPVSFRLQGRMGTRDELRDTINVCRSLGVRVYADAVINHMVGSGNDGNPHHRFDSGSCVSWGSKNTSADFPPSSAPQRNGSSPFFSQGFTYRPINGRSPMQEFPVVPYGPLDFHCERPLNSWDSPLDLNAGWLTGLVDVNTERDNVRRRIADYMTDLLSIGFSGFRVDAAKHVRPEDLAAIFGYLKKNMGGSFPKDFVTWLEVLTGGEGDMLYCNPHSGYSYSDGLKRSLLSNGLTATEVDQIKLWYDAYPKQPGLDCGQLAMTRKAIQNDDADQQTPGSSSRDMGDQGTVLVIAKDIPLHRSFEVKLFANPNGAQDNDNDYPIRLVLSSFWLPKNPNDYGFPDGNSMCSDCRVDCATCDPDKDVPYTPAFKSNATAYSTSARFTRVHRDGSIIAAMRSWMHLPPI